LPAAWIRIGALAQHELRADVDHDAARLRDGERPPALAGAAVGAVIEADGLKLRGAPYAGGVSRDRMWTVPVRTIPTFSVGERHELFTIPEDIFWSYTTSRPTASPS
jgi:hypothetical protein